MLNYIKKIPILHSSITESDLEKIEFPIITEEILDIRFENKHSKETLSYKNSLFADKVNGKAAVGDVISIKFTMQKLKNVEIDLEINNILQYYNDIKTIMEMRAIGGRHDFSLGGSRVDIMDRSGYIDNNNQSKLFIELKEDIVSIYADNAVIKDIKYVRDNQLDYQA